MMEKNEKEYQVKESRGLTEKDKNIENKNNYSKKYKKR